MPDTFFDSPPVLQGDERTQLQQLSGYLFTMSSKLNEALMEVSVRETNLIAQQIGGSSGSSGSSGDSALTEKDRAEQLQQYNTLKGMIVKTAEIVKTEMEEIRTSLTEKIDAQSSQYGDLYGILRNDITVNAEGIEQLFTYKETVEGLNEETGAFITKTQGSIFIGTIDPLTMETGIAIGENITVIDDVTGEAVINNDNKYATFTKNELAFWQGEAKVAYFSSGELYINKARIIDALRVGNFVWKEVSGGSMALISMG